ncbi:MAG: GyrI-like domain-containing protein [Clostridia bacterium]|nr:GyrI-like domain-containing protein [Clostridia bacterium]
METKIVEKGEIKMIGIEIKTTNKDWKCMKDIPLLWNMFISKELGKEITNKVHPGITLGVYTDYESNEMGVYSFLIGCQVSTFDHVPAGMVCKTISASKYCVLTAKGKMPEKLGDAWKAVWNSDLRRTYTGDFELYDERYDGTENSEVDLYIAIQ